MATRSYEITHSFGSASMLLAVLLVALTAGSELSRARGGYIWTLAAAGIVAGVESQSSTPSNGGACQPPEWLLGVWIFSDYTITQGKMTHNYSNANMMIFPVNLTFTSGSPSYEYAGGGLRPGRGEITSVSGEVVKAAIWPVPRKGWSSGSPVTIAKTTRGIAVAFSVTAATDFPYGFTDLQVSVTYTRVPDRLELPGWLPGRWALIRATDTDMLTTVPTIPAFAMTLVFKQGSPTYDFTRSPSSMGKDVIVSIKNGIITLCFPPNICAGLGAVRATLSQVPEGVALEVVLREGFDLRLMPLLKDVSGIPTSGTNLIIVAAVNNVLHFRIFDGDGKVVVDTDEKSLTEQARQIEDLGEQLKRLTEQARRIEDLRKQLESLWPPHDLTPGDKDRVITAVGSIVGHTLGEHPHSKESCNAIYTRVEDHPVLPAWLPGWWVLGRSTMTRAGVTTTLGPGLGPVPIPLALTFTQGSPLYDFSGGAVWPGQALVSTNDVVEVRPWSTWPTKALPDSARITQVPEGIALDFAATIEGDRSPSRFRALYTRVQDHPEFPAWLPGRWVLSRSTLTPAGSPPAPQPGQAWFPTTTPWQGWFPTTLAFKQGSPTYDYAGGPVLPGKGTIFPKGEGAGITPWPVIQSPPLPTDQPPPTGESFSPAQATVARAAEGVVIELSGTTKAGEPVRYQGVYTPFREHPELPAWLTGKWSLTELDMSAGGETHTVPLDQMDAPVPSNLTFTQGSSTYVYAGGLVPAGYGEVLTSREGVVNLSIGSTDTPLAITSVTATPTPEGIEVTFSIMGSIMSYKGLYTGGQEHRTLPVNIGGQEHRTLPDWLPGKWGLTHHTMTRLGWTHHFPAGTGVIQVATTLTFTQGRTTYKYEGGPVGLGKGTIALRDGVVRITLWPTNVPSLPATIARTPKGIVVEFSHTTHGGGPSDFRVFYSALPVHTGGQEHSALPDWLPGKWALTHHTMTHTGWTHDFPAGIVDRLLPKPVIRADGGWTHDFPAGTGVIQVATTLIFTQGSPTYDYAYAGGPVPPGKGTIAFRDGVVRITAPWPINVPSLPATIARTPEGIVVEFSYSLFGGEPSDFRVFYSPAR